MGTKSRIAVYSLVLGIVSFLNLLGVEKALVAIIAGWIGLVEIREEEKTGRGFAYAGIILGSLYIVVLTVLAVVKGPELLQMLKGMKG